MKVILPLFLLSMTCSGAIAGQVVYENMYSNRTLIQGEGQTLEEAEKDALSALPAGWLRDRKNSPVIECTLSAAVIDGTRCDLKVADDKLRITIPVVQSLK